jgi:hypothetical protein
LTLNLRAGADSGAEASRIFSLGLAAAAEETVGAIDAPATAARQAEARRMLNFCCATRTAAV